MGQTFEHLIERIQTEAIDKADAEAERLVDRATRTAAEIVREAEDKAAAIVRTAKEESARYTEQSTRTLEQAARNLLMSIGEGVQTILDDLVEGAVDEAMDIGLLRELIGKTVDGYLASGGKEGRIEVLLNEDDRAALTQFFSDRYQEMVEHDLEIKVDANIYKGFRVSYGDERVYHDFTIDAIAEALVTFLRPHLSEVVERAAKDQSADDEGGAG